YGTGSVLSQNLVIVGNSIGNAGENGIAVYSFLHRAGFESQALQIDANTIDHVTGHGIFVSNIGYDEGVSLVQNFAIDSHLVSNVSGAGIIEQTFFDAEFGSMFLAQTGEIDANQVTNTGKNGIAVFTEVSEGPSYSSHVSQALQINDNVLSGIHGYSSAPGG